MAVNSSASLQALGDTGAGSALCRRDLERAPMIDHLLRSLILAASAASMMLSGCSRKPPMAPASATASASAVATAPSSPASGATTQPCASDDIACEERLYELEEALFAYEAGVEQKLAGAAQACWKIDSELFRSSIDQCTTVECKETALLARIASLHDLQPQSQQVSLRLPESPLLLAVLAPEQETSAPAPNRKPDLELRGGLIHAMTHGDHMGIAVSVGGRDHVFIFDMEIGNQPAHDEVLGLVGTSPTKQISVRGYSQVAPSGVANFDTTQCRWVYEHY